MDTLALVAMLLAFFGLLAFLAGVFVGGWPQWERRRGRARRLCELEKKEEEYR